MTTDPQPLHLRPPAAPWRRVAARIIDAATVLTVLWVLVVLRVLWFMPGLTEQVQPAPWGRAFGVTVSFVVLAAVYEAVFVSHNAGQTPGKDILDIRVVGPGAPGTVSAWRALARALPLLAVPLVRPWWAALAVLALGALWLAGPRRLRAGDLLAGTRIVPYERDVEDPTARRPVGRHRRRAMTIDEDRIRSRRPASTLARAGGNR